MGKFAIIIRGHIRTAFINNTLHDLIKDLVNKYNIDIFIHTWTISEAKSSWRPLNTSSQFTVTNNIIENYFDDIKRNIKQIIIDDDTNIELFGSLDGNVSNSNIPKIAWKRMWYGINKITNIVTSFNNYDLLLSTRFDNANIPQSINLNYGFDKICKMIDEYNKLSNKKIIFMANNNAQGIDNFFIGSPNHLTQLCNKFHTELDNILASNPAVICQEYLVFYEAQKINEKTNIHLNKIITKKLLNPKTRNMILRIIN